MLFGDFDIGISCDLENVISYFVFGEILWYLGGLSEIEILFFYGGVMFVSIVGQFAGNYFFIVMGNCEWLWLFGEYVLWKGVLDIIFE